MEKDKISVIVPVYNGAAWLAECVESIRRQTWENWELLILDDSSTDGTTEIARRLAAAEGRIRLICREKKGVSSARNQGLSEALGEYVTFVDADDKLDTQMLERLLYLIKKETSDLVLCDYYKWDREKVSQFRQNQKKTDNSENSENEAYSVTIADREQYLSEYLLHGNTRCWSILYARQTIGEVRFREELTIGEDMMFLMDLLPHLSRVCITAYKGYYYRINETGAMLRPFTPSYMDEIKAWKLACSMVEREYPKQRDRAYSILAVSAMLVAGKLSRFSAKARRPYRDCVKTCRSTVWKALQIPGARGELPEGYRVKTALFSACPNLYLGLYHLWKGGRS